MKIVLNKCYGGYSISSKAAIWCYEQGWKELATPIKEYFTEKERTDPVTERFSLAHALRNWDLYCKGELKSSFVTTFTLDKTAVLDTRPKDRTHPILVKCIETLGKEANGSHADLKIIEIPDDVKGWHIEEYDGIESVHEDHTSWG